MRKAVGIVLPTPHISSSRNKNLYLGISRTCDLLESTVVAWNSPVLPQQHAINPIIIALVPSFATMELLLSAFIPSSEVFTLTVFVQVPYGFVVCAFRLFSPGEPSKISGGSD